MRRALIGISLGAALLCVAIALYPYALWSVQAVLSVCIIQNPGDTCDSGGNNGGGGTPLTPYSPTSGEVQFQGIAYPGSRVTLARDGQTLALTTAGPDANFQFNIKNVTPGTYTYGIWSEDGRGIRSLSNSFTVAVSANVGTLISGIYLPPTIDVDLSQVKRGDPLTILGATAPNSQISILVHSTQEFIHSAISDSKGIWKTVIDTLPLEEGAHSAAARAKSQLGMSPLSAAVSFIVGNKNISKTIPLNSGAGMADVNGDNKINLVDFSMMAYWYKRPLTPAASKVDLNKDGKVDLRDFSILAYYWNS